jgi:Spy/CpxP family protein refolding chaperone
MMETRRAALYLTLVFVLGAAAGGVGMFWAERHGLVQAGAGPAHMTRAGAQDWLTRELRLTAEQRQQLGVILDDTEKGYRQVRERVRPEFETVRQSGREKIRAILTVEQRARFEELVRQLDEERARRRADAGKLR